MSQLTRGIFGRKPTTAGSSDVFSLSNQYSSSVSGTWPTSGLWSGKFIITCSPYVTTSTTVFNAYEKSAKDGKYYPTGMIDTLPRGSTTNTSVTSTTVTPGGTHVVITSGTTSTSSQYIDIWKKSTAGLSEYQYLSTITPGTNFTVARFDPTGTYLAVGFSYGGSPPTPTRLRVWKRTGDTFTELSTPPDPLAGAATIISTYSLEWNYDGSSLAMAFTASPYIAIYNRSGDTFTKLSTPATIPPAYGASLSWNPTGTSLALVYNNTTGNPSLIIYNRSGDTFTSIAGLPSLPGIKGSGRANMSWSPDGTLLAIPRSGGTAGYITVLSRSGDTFTILSTPSVYGPGGDPYSCLFLSSTELLITDGQKPEIWDVSGTTITRPYAYKFGMLAGVRDTPLTGTSGYIANPYSTGLPGTGGSTYIITQLNEVVPIPGL